MSLVVLFSQGLLMKNLRYKFFKRFADLPEGSRSEIIVVHNDGEPFTWRSVKVEVDNESTKGERLLVLLDSLGFL